jgi:hypothetical protein
MRITIKGRDLTRRKEYLIRALISTFVSKLKVAAAEDFASGNRAAREEEIDNAARRSAKEQFPDLEIEIEISRERPESELIRWRFEPH